MDKAIFLDRDGTLNDDPNYYVYKIEDFKLLPGVIEGLKLLSKEFIFFIITNQSGIGIGKYTEDDMHKFNKKLKAELKKESIWSESEEYVLIAASLAEDLAFEIVRSDPNSESNLHYGSLTYYLARVLDRIGEGATYLDLIKNIQNLIRQESEFAIL